MDWGTSLCQAMTQCIHKLWPRKIVHVSSHKPRNTCGYVGNMQSIIRESQHPAVLKAHENKVQGPVNDKGAFPVIGQYCTKKRKEEPVLYRYAKGSKYLQRDAVCSLIDRSCRVMQAPTPVEWAWGWNHAPQLVGRVFRSAACSCYSQT